MSRCRKLCSIAIAAAVLAAEVGIAGAGGIQLPTRGVRPSARGGAFVAGADDLSSLWFNPAGLAHLLAADTRGQLLFDLAYVEQNVTYRRIDSGNNPLDEVENAAPGLPIPSIAGSLKVSERGVVAMGLYAPYAALGRYPDEGPQRYSMIDYSDSALVVFEVAYAHRLSDRLTVGGGLQNMVTNIVARGGFSACPEQVVCAPEDPDFDAVGQVNQTQYFTPSAIVGAQFELNKQWSFGGAFQAPFYITGEGRFQTQLPNAPFFGSASVDGDRASLKMWLPPVLRAGAQYTHSPRLRIEAAASIEFWSIHNSVKLEPKDVKIVDVPGVGEYEVGPLEIDRDFGNSYALHLGGEGKPLADKPLTVLAGYILETSAAPKKTLSVLTVDGLKHILSVGAGYQLGRFALNAVLGYAIVADQTIGMDEGRARQLTPIRTDNPVDVFVNWGEYSASWFFAGAGLATGF